jgi:hypothetical protein
VISAAIVGTTAYPVNTFIASRQSDVNATAGELAADSTIRSTFSI